MMLPRTMSLKTLLPKTVSLETMSRSQPRGIGLGGRSGFSAGVTAWIITWSLILVMFPWARVAEAQGTPVKALQDGIFAVQRGDFAKARLHFEDVVDADSQNAMANYYLAVCDAHEDKASDALLRIQCAIAYGFPSWRDFPKDPFFAKLAKNSEFTAGLKALIERYEDREKGILRGFKFDFDVTTPTEENYDLASFAGKNVVILFVDTRQQDSREAVAYTAVLFDTQPENVAFIGIGFSPGKERVEQDKQLASFISDNIVPYPVANGSSDLRSALQPFRKHPTLLVLDTQGVPRRIVEGLPKKSPLSQYEKAMKETMELSRSELSKSDSSKSGANREKGASRPKKEKP